MTNFDHEECLRETLQELREDAALLRLSILGSQDSMDKLTHTCLLRLTDYLNQHVKDVCVLCKPSAPTSNLRCGHCGACSDAKLVL